MSEAKQPCDNVKANEDGAALDAQEAPGAEQFDVATIQSFMAEIEAAGGVAAVMGAMKEVAANNAAKRSGLAERIKAHTSVYSDGDLATMELGAMAKLADVLDSTAKRPVPAANYAASVSGTASGNGEGEPVVVAGLGTLRAYAAE